MKRQSSLHRESSDRCTDVLQALLERYARAPRAITVDFRQLVEWLPAGSRATHMIHPYPAKLLPQIAHLFTSNGVLSRPGDTILDPFCGSGTVLLEAALAGRNALGVDANPLARLIAQVKVRPVQPKSLVQASRRLLRRMPAEAEPPAVVNRAYWFHPHVVRQLGRLAHAVARTHDRAAREFFAVCLSNCVRRVSLADPRLTVPVRLRSDQYGKRHWLHGPTVERLRRLKRVDVIDVFQDVVDANIGRMANYIQHLPDGPTAAVIGTDARGIRHELGTDVSGSRMRRNSIDLIITSPPYAGAQKYIRASSLSLGWLSLARPEDLRELENRNIGREHYPRADYDGVTLHTGIRSADQQLQRIGRKNPLRAHINATYLREMEQALAEMVRVLRPGGHLVLVMANNRVCGEEFRTQDFVRALALRQGLELRLRLVDEITSRGLMTRRNTTAGLIERESVFLFVKPSRAGGSARES